MSSYIAQYHQQEPLELETFINDDMQISFKPSSRKVKKLISNITIWLEAWSAYEEALTSVFGVSLYRELNAYKRFIIEQDKRYLFSAVYNYDVRHRSILGGVFYAFCSDKYCVITSVF